ncbi:MAG: hypothetical protein ACON3Z_05595, partial [Bradymonadia bacterium]
MFLCWHRLKKGVRATAVLPPALLLTRQSTNVNKAVQQFAKKSSCLVVLLEDGRGRSGGHPRAANVATERLGVA